MPVLTKITPKPHNSESILQFWSRGSRASRRRCRDDRPVSIGLPPILESYWWKTLLTSAEIKACLAFAADRYTPGRTPTKKPGFLPNLSVKTK
ncbi:hypothetical protein [Microcoleus vaginatus]|uniref:hypothetical protein n=1 Tax=Microcoleus vaginatus TaxID=119532 RepID=UPI00110FA9E0